jgi:CBS domain-containing protein
MKVADVMTKAPVSCTADTNLGVAVELMWKHNCGMLPVVDNEQKVISVITDRDICIALGTRNRLAGEITVGDVATRSAISCRSSQDIRSALAKMIEEKVRRLPVVGAGGKLEGILSLDDIVERTDTGARKPDGLTAEDVLGTLKSLYVEQLSHLQKEATV